MRIHIPEKEAKDARFWTKKGLGQHLLRDASVAEAIVNGLQAKPGEGILEIGPGLGALTERLLAQGVPVLAVEIDAKACVVLQQRFGTSVHFHLIQGDVLELDLKELLAKHWGQRPFHIAANLPYYITTPILAKILEGEIPFGRMLALTQREVALRLAASPGKKDYGALSVMAQFRCQVQILRRVLPGAFTPVPRVESALVLFQRRAQPAVAVKDAALFFKIVRSAFGKRRKMLRNSLFMAESLALSAAQVEDLLAGTGIAPERRAETLSMEDFAKLADALAVQRSKVAA